MLQRLSTHETPVKSNFSDHFTERQFVKIEEVEV